MSTSGHHVKRIEPGSFQNDLHRYPRVLSAVIHPVVDEFMHMDNRQIIDRYIQLHPVTEKAQLEKILRYPPQHYRWAGADLICATTAKGNRQVVVIENNSCPSGQKSMPRPSGASIQWGYRELVEESFKPFCKSIQDDIEGVTAVLYDKNFVENSGYASVLSDVFQQPVYLVTCLDKPNEHLRSEQDYLEIRTNDQEWQRVTAAFRYVTQKPWNRLPLQTKSQIYNPVVACLAGGRNKSLASKAYARFNNKFNRKGLEIRCPATVCDVQKKDVPEWVAHFGGQAVVKVPYSNAGQGVYTICNSRELKAFMNAVYDYDKFIVQAMIGHYAWEKKHSKHKYYHLGTVPDTNGHTYAFDLRMMVCSTPEGFRPLSMYARRAHLPLPSMFRKEDDSWGFLGTNLSTRDEAGEWTTDTDRLLMMDLQDFPRLGLGLDDLVDGYVQTVMSTVAIDHMAIRLMHSKGHMKKKLLSRLNPDKRWLHEILDHE